MYFSTWQLYFMHPPINHLTQQTLLLENITDL